MILEIWMAHRIFVSGAAFCSGDYPHHEYAALCHTSERLAFLPVTSCPIHVLQGQGQSTKEVFSRIDFGGCITLFLMVSVTSCVSLVLACDMFHARSDRRSHGSA